MIVYEQLSEGGWRKTDLYSPPHVLARYYQQLTDMYDEDLRHEKAMAEPLGYDANAWAKYKKEQYKIPLSSQIHEWDRKYLKHNLR